MTARPKFLFDVDFGSDRAKDIEPKITVVAHQAEVADAAARGYRQGLNAAEAQANTESERRRAAAFERIATAIEGLSASLAALERKLETEAIEVAFAVARKLAPELIAREPLAEIAALAAGCLGELRSAPHVVVRVNDSLHDSARDELARIAGARGFEGRLVVLGETEIAPGDCRIEWADGGIVRNRVQAEAAVAEAVARYIAARPAIHSGSIGEV
jgi:flagellar assembly protein FliH